MVQYVPLKPITWPQDTLTIPVGQGGMPPIEFGNLAVTGAEFFALTADFTFPHTLTTLQTQTQILPTPQDGDFWCDEISCISWIQPGLGVRNLLVFMDGMLTIRDIRTGRSLINSPSPPFIDPTSGITVTPNALPLAFFSKFSRSGIDGDPNYDGQFPPPNGFRDTGTMIQPYCFTRQGGIELTVTNNNAPPFDAATDFFVTICFAGWKEYANASH